MATFLVLPPREILEHLCQGFVARLLPGVSPPAALWELLAEQVVAAQPDPSQTFLIHREDLPDAADAAGGLRAAFGAEPGDRVVEVGPPRAGGPAAVREWVVPGVSAAVPAR